MLETLAAVLLAHALADFLFQTRTMAEGKRARRPLPFLAHTAAVAALAAVALGAVTPIALWSVLALTVAHFALDLLKSALPDRRLWPFLLDQALHLASLAVLALLQPGLWAAGLWAATPAAPSLPPIMALAAGALIATRAGGFAVGLLMIRWEGKGPQGLRDGGMVIGLLERGLIFLLVLVGQPAGVGFLIAAKSVLRYEATRDDQDAAEYVIIGTLASFGWAIAAAYATLALLSGLPPLGIAPLAS
jgi:hypothetical protein